MNQAALQGQARRYYEAKLAAHGATPAGADWNSQASQELRFEQLFRLWPDQSEAAVVDYGCGYGALAGYLRSSGWHGPYTGYDISPGMIDAARIYAGNLAQCAFTSSRDMLEPADYAVASGIFNVKLDASDELWSAYVRETLADLDALGRRGFAFNVLTGYSDADKRRPDLYYADPLALFDYCKTSFSTRVALLHDYLLYEFTIVISR